MAPQERLQSRLRLSRRDFKYFAFLILAVGLFFWDVVFLQKAFLSGDHLIQHYPWAKFLQDSLRHYRLPWWTSQIHSGFPLLAEGQIGAFYPPNILFLFFLPLRWAYNYEVLFHFILGAFFFYLYLRELKISSQAALFAALIFLFGSCEGGFFYNITSQRVSVWFPLSLYFIERLIEKRKPQDASFLGITFSLQIFAGYLQVAIYCIAFSTLYFLLRIGSGEKKSRNATPLMHYGLAGLAGLGISAIQWVPSIRLSVFSARAEALEPLAYMGSVLPFFGMTLLFPAWTGLWRGGVYGGVLGLFFALWSLFSQKTRIEKLWIGIAVLSVLLALGKFSPVYLLIVKVFRIYFFRIPSKFLFFTSFALSVLAAFGFDQFLKDGKKSPAFGKSFVFLSGFFLFTVSAVVIGHVLARAYEPSLLNLLENYVRNHIYGQPYHPHSWETYQERLHYYYDYFLQITRLTAKETGWPILVFLSQMAAGIFVMSKKKKTAAIGLTLLLFVDLYGYAQINTRTDLDPYKKVEMKSPLVDILRRDHEISRTHEFNTDPLRLGSYPFTPNQNMLLGIQDTGIYSPFAFSEYKRYLGNLGGVDDSLYQNRATLESLEQNREILNRLNVKYILSNVPLKTKGLEKVAEDQVILYQNMEFWPRAFWVENITGDSVFRSIQRVDIVEAGEGRMVFQTAGLGKGYIVVSEQNYPGWKAKQNGRVIEPVALGNCLKALPISGGDRVELFYEEKYKNPLAFMSLLSVLFALFIPIARQAGKY